MPFTSAQKPKQTQQAKAAPDAGLRSGSAARQTQPGASALASARQEAETGSGSTGTTNGSAGPAWSIADIPVGPKDGPSASGYAHPLVASQPADAVRTDTAIKAKAGTQEGAMRGPRLGSIGRAFRNASQDSASAATMVQRGKASGDPLPADLRASEIGTWLNADKVRLHADGFADHAARDLHADAFTVGNDIFFRSGKYEPGSSAGRHLVRHELAHVAQFQAGSLYQSEHQLEREANQAAGFGQRASNRKGSGYAPMVLRAPGQKCTSVTIVLPHTIVFYGEGGQVRLNVSFREPVPAGDYKLGYDAQAVQLTISPWPTDKQVIYVSGGGVKNGNQAQVDAAKAQQDLYMTYLSGMADPVPLTVQGEGAAGGGSPIGGAPKHPAKSGGGDGQGQAPGKTGDPKAGDPGAGGAGKTGDPKAGDPGGAKGGSKDGTGTGSGNVDPNAPKGATGGDGSAAPSADAKVPVVKLTDQKQLDELKKRGLLPAKTADDIKAKLDKQENLSYEETLALLDAMDQLVTKKPPAPSDAAHESWLKWARYIQQHRAQMSGKTNTGGDITIAEMNEILAKYKQYVGVTDAPPAAPGSDPKDIKKFEPEKRKSWNSLPQYQKDIWTKYAAKYGPPVGDSDSTDLRLTDDVKFNMAMSMSPDYMQQGAHEAAVQLFHDPIFIGGTVVGIGFYVAAWLAPEPIFSKATAATITAALLTVFSVSEIKNFAVAWMRLSDESAAATSFEALEAAAENFGKAIGGIGLRVLVTIATLLLGKALPSPKPIAGGGGGGMAPATAGGPGMGASAFATEGAAIKVLADGTIIILAPQAAGNVNSMMAGKGGGGGTTAPNEPPKQRIEVKPDEVPEDTHGLRDKPPGAGKPTEGSEVGNFSHKNFEKLKSFLPKNSNVVSEDVPPGTTPEYEVPNPSYKKGLGPRIDRLDRPNGTVIEIKPHALYDQGLAEAKAYALEMDKYEPLSGGRKWAAKCITYDYDAVMAFLKQIGYIK